jgi:hypothetical protein
VVADTQAEFLDVSAIGSRQIILARMQYGNRSSSVDTVTVLGAGKTKIILLRFQAGARNLSPNLSKLS